MSKSHRIPMGNYHEQQMFGFRCASTCWCRHPGDGKAAKRSYNRRQRRILKRDTEED